MTADIWVKNVQLEVGKVATPFEHRSYGEELALCERYFEVLRNTGDIGIFSTMFTGTTNNRARWDFRTEKRATPSIDTSMKPFSGTAPSGSSQSATGVTWYQAAYFYQSLTGYTGPLIASADAEL